jgi:hypothetical protein
MNEEPGLNAWVKMCVDADGLGEGVFDRLVEHGHSVGEIRGGQAVIEPEDSQWATAGATRQALLIRAGMTGLDGRCIFLALTEPPSEALHSCVHSAGHGPLTLCGSEPDPLTLLDKRSSGLSLLNSSGSH